MKDPITGVNDEVIIEVAAAANSIGVKFSGAGADLDSFTLLRNFVIDGSLCSTSQGILISATAGRAISPTIEGNTIQDCMNGILVQSDGLNALCDSLIRFNHISAKNIPVEGFALFENGIELIADNNGTITCTIRSNRVFHCRHGVSADDLIDAGNIDIRCMCNVVAYNEWGYFVKLGQSTVILENETVAHGLSTSPPSWYVCGVVTQSPNTEIHNSIIWLPDYGMITGIDLFSLTGHSSYIDAFSIIKDHFHPDPLFSNPTNGDFTLLQNSPAINAGDTQRIRPGSPYEVEYDHNGAPRIIDAYRDSNMKLDVGAYEYTEVSLDVISSYGDYDSTMKPAVNLQIGGTGILSITSSNPNGADIFYLWLTQNEHNILMPNLGNLLVDLTGVPPLLTLAMGSFTSLQLPINLPANPAYIEADFFLQGAFYDPTASGPLGNSGAFTRRVILNLNL